MKALAPYAFGLSAAAFTCAISSGKDFAANGFASACLGSGITSSLIIGLLLSHGGVRRMTRGVSVLIVFAALSPAILGITMFINTINLVAGMWLGITAMAGVLLIPLFTDDE